MGSTGEPDRKRRHFSSISPTAGAAAKKQPLTPCSEDKKIDVAVLKYKNQKLAEQLEAQKFEYLALENRFNQLKEKQRTHTDALIIVNDSWEQLVGDLESISACTNGSSNHGINLGCNHMPEDGTSCPTEEDFLCRLLETGATESSGFVSPSQMENDIHRTQSSTNSVLGNVMSSFNDVWHVNKELASALLATLPKDDSSRQLQSTANELLVELSNVLIETGDLHLKHRQVAEKVQNHRDLNAQNKAEHRRLTEELLSTVAELEESNRKLAILKTTKDAAQGTPILFPALGNKHVTGEKIRDKQKELQDMEVTLKDLSELVSNRLAEIRRLHEERTEILNKLASFQNTLMNIKTISSSRAFQLLSEQLQKSKEEMERCRTSLEKLQVEKENFIWHEKEVTVKVDLADISHRVSGHFESRISELEHDLQKLIDGKTLLEVKLEEAARGPGRKEIVSEFKTLVSSLPKDMDVMQSELSKHKEAASKLQSLRAEVQSLSCILNRKENELVSLSGRSAQDLSEIKRLRTAAQDIRKTSQELKLFLEMYRRESTDSRDVMDSRDAEYRAWALVQILKSSLDEHKLELRVKAANEAEAISQQRLATAEAEIAELRQKLEASERDLGRLSETLKSKHEEGDAYLSEIESIGQAYEDMQTQNQHLLQQVTERDDYNIKLVLESVKARQVQNALHLEVQSLDRKLQQANSLLDLYNLKIVQLDDQLKVWSEQVGQLVEDGWQKSVSLEDAQRKLVDVRGETQQLRQSFDGVQTRVEMSRLDVAELLVELEKERFNKKRIEESLEVMTRKAVSLRSQAEGSSVLEKLRQEVGEYRGILKCGICHDRQKEVVVAKCYHLFCNQCVQKSIESRHRKCPTCGSSFGPNDVKPIYI
ncbi:E3 ubiquitin-protein ligase BRE1-like 1 isoform X1 [Typha latifolia]|uniref:E3 ubiquitin-protein ligase BRE1-like 1 isoform X1 n=1 Tax=Typha latifolia TaxID=4733 RepID=UPI003C2B067C